MLTPELEASERVIVGAGASAEGRGRPNIIARPQGYSESLWAAGAGSVMPWVSI